MDAERGQCGVDYLVSRVVGEFTQPLIKERRESEREGRGDRGSEERTVNCLSIQGEGRGRKEEEEEGGETGGRGNTRRYYERHQGGGEKFGRRDKDGGIKADKAAEDGAVRTESTRLTVPTASTRFSDHRLTDPAQVGLTRSSSRRSRLGFHSFSPQPRARAQPFLSLFQPDERQQLFPERCFFFLLLFLREAMHCGGKT